MIVPRILFIFTGNVANQETKLYETNDKFYGKVAFLGNT